MAVFWFGWAKKLKNIFTKQQADQYYLQKELPNQLQVVKGNVDFYKNVVVKQNGYVDRVDTNAPTSMINKRYLEEQTLSKTSTGTQTVVGQVVLSKTGEVIKINSNSDTATYLSGYKSNNQRVWYFGKGSSTSDNFIIGADRGDIKLEPNGNVDVNNKKIVNVAAPTNNNDVANKQYVDNKALNIIQPYHIFETNPNTAYRNVDKINTTAIFTNSEVNYDYPLTVSFDRYNGNNYLGTFTFTIQHNTRNNNSQNPNYMVATQMYYSTSSQHMEIGQMCGLRFTKTYIEVSCWDSADRIKNIVVKGIKTGV